MTNAKKCLKNKVFENGKTTYFTKEEVTLIVEQMKLSRPNQSTFTAAVQVVSTELTPALKINQAMELMQEGYEEQLAILKAKNIEMQPKAEVYDRICNSETLKSVESVASNLGFGKNNFFALMRGMGIFYYSAKDADGKKVNLPKQEYKDRGYFVTKEEPYSRGDKDCLYTKIYVTGKGEIWLSKKLFEETAENYMERAINNCPECNNTYIDKITSKKIKTYSYSEVALEAGEDEQTIINFCKAKGWIDENNIPYSFPDFDYFYDNLLTEKGKDHILATFLKIKNAERGMKKTSCGKGE